MYYFVSMYVTSWRELMGHDFVWCMLLWCSCCHALHHRNLQSCIVCIGHPIPPFARVDLALYSCCMHWSSYYPPPHLTPLVHTSGPLSQGNYGHFPFVYTRGLWAIKPKDERLSLNSYLKLLSSHESERHENCHLVKFQSIFTDTVKWMFLFRIYVYKF